MGRHASCDCGLCRKCKGRIYMRGWTARNRERARQASAKFREQNIEKVRAADRARGYRPGPPEKVKARGAVKHALMRGVLVRRPCEVCGAAEVQAHHDDYGKPLDVRWLCTTHHGELHRTY